MMILAKIVSAEESECRRPSRAPLQMRQPAKRLRAEWGATGETDDVAHHVATAWKRAKTMARTLATIALKQKHRMR